MKEVQPSWNLDVAGAQKLEAMFTDIVGNDLVVDLSEVSFVASSGLRVILKAAQKLKVSGGSLVIRGANATVKEVFRISGLASVISIEN